MNDKPVKYIAHSADPQKGVPVQLYSDHIFNVVDAAVHHAKRLCKFITHDHWKGPAFKALILAAEFHDLGKLDALCQKVMLGKLHGKMPNHVDAGVAYTLSKYKETNKLEWLLAAVIIHAHHINLVDKNKTTFDPPVDIFNPNSSNTIVPAKSLRCNTPMSAYAGWEEVRKDFCFQNDPYLSLSDYVDELLNAYEEMHLHSVQTVDNNGFLYEQYFNKEWVSFPEDPKACDEMLSSFVTMKMLLSVLCDSDHEDSALHHDDPYPRRKTTLNIKEVEEAFNQYIKKLQSSSKGDPKRMSVRRRFVNQCRKIDTEFLVAGIYGTVGVGKTLGTMGSAISLAKHHGLDTINYVLPYTALIDQSANKYREVFSSLPNNPEYFVSAIHCCIKSRNLWSRKYANGFNSPINLTTSVNFFDSILQNSTARVAHIHKFAGSVICIEEFHSIAGYEHWPILLTVLYEMAKDFSCRILFSSGTPVAFWELDMIKEMISPQVWDFFTQTPSVVRPTLYKEMLRMEGKRVLKKDLSELTAPKLAKKILSTKGSKMIVVNTRKKAVRYAKYLREYIDHHPLHHGKYKIFVRHSLLAPCDREKQLAEIVEHLRTCKDGVFPILIATQGSDLGLDISFDHGFKEQSSYDSLLQASGRINRECEFNYRSKMYLFRLPRNAFMDADPDPLYDNPLLQHRGKIAKGYLGYRKSQVLIDIRKCTQVANEELADKAKDSAFVEDTGRMFKLYDDLRYGTLGEIFSIINAPSVVVIVNPEIAKKIVSGGKATWMEVQQNSVTLNLSSKDVLRQMEEQKILQIQLAEEEDESILELLEQEQSEKEDGTSGTQSRKSGTKGDLYFWNSKYDPENFGILAGWWDTALPTPDWMTTMMV